MDLTKQPSFTLHLPERMADKQTDVLLECSLFYCGDDGACRMKGLVFSQPVVITQESVDQKVTISLTHHLK